MARVFRVYGLYMVSKAVLSHPARWRSGAGPGALRGVGLSLQTGRWLSAQGHCQRPAMQSGVRAQGLRRETVRCPGLPMPGPIADGSRFIA